LIVSIQTKLAYRFGSYCWGRGGKKILLLGAGYPPSYTIVRSAEECSFIQNAKAAWRTEDFILKQLYFAFKSYLKPIAKLQNRAL